MRRCSGCGAILQSEDKTRIGYTPKEDSSYCQRCFRLIHYDDLTISMKTGIDPDAVLNGIADMDGMILYVADLFDFEAGMIAGLARKIKERDVILACTKRDLLPDTVSHDKIAQFVFGRLKEYGIQIKELVLLSGRTMLGVEELKEVISRHAKGRSVIVMGKANSGKSTLLNALSGTATLTSSRYPGTTLDFNRLEIDGITYIDTPGIELQNSMLMAVPETELKTLIPAKTVKPTVYQIHEDQSYAVGGLVRVDVECSAKGTVTWYLSDRLYLHRSRLAGADALWQKQYGKLLVPTPVKQDFRRLSYHPKGEKTDIVIDGLGWCSVSKEITAITVHSPKQVNVTFRKAML
ncbi:MAG: ribosome biogenesis GTPase YqeH [Solobacterium sp.]|nr:ribosome biogenesis GTPase YqeH [Solobacterium sp.]